MIANPTYHRINEMIFIRIQLLQGTRLFAIYFHQIPRIYSLKKQDVATKWKNERPALQSPQHHVTKKTK